MQSLFTYVSPPEACRYLPDQVWQLEHELMLQIRPGEYMERLRQGWRRFGHAVFRPVCPSCRRCQSLRVPVATFRPNESQRRAVKANRADVTIVVGTPRVSPTRRRLYARFHRQQQEAKGWPAQEDDDLQAFLHNPFPTQEWSYFRGGRRIAVGYVDALPDGLSAIYFIYDPAERRRSLGTFNVVSLIAAARERGLPHVYLGYYVEGCRSLEYKARFTPNEVLRPDGTWTPFLT
jgi:arginine-tRNA-protein transferase